MALLGFFLPPCAAAGIRTHVSKLAPLCGTLIQQLSYRDRGLILVLDKSQVLLFGPISYNNAIENIKWLLYVFDFSNYKHQTVT